MGASGGVCGLARWGWMLRLGLGLVLRCSWAPLMGEIGESQKMENKWISNGSGIPEKMEINGLWLKVSIEIDSNMENPIK